MFKKFIIAFTISLFAIVGIKAKGATYGDPCIKFNQDTYYFSLETQNNTTTFTYKDADNVTRNYVKPVMVYRNNVLYLISKPMTGGIYQTWGNNNQYNSSTNGGSIIVPLSTTYTLFSTPMFNDFENASKYSCGETFDTSHLLGGLIFNYEFDDTVTYSNIITNFDYSFSYSGASPINSFSMFFEFKEENPVPDDCNRIFVLDYYFLEKTKLEQLYYAYGQDGLSWNALYSVYKTIRDGGASGILQFPNNNLEGKLTFGFSGLF